ncbi:MAG: SDR family NAD(P)-dependent oxidoreductase, partial [Desulfuromonadales bacterium]|nr:SDR family NAD(P)-dependent oxidoreductase [Desulfuromonadales bacterium]
MQIKDKVAVVTGGASGIGRAMATRFLAEGARGVVIADINESQLNDVAAEIGAMAIKTDVSMEPE